MSLKTKISIFVFGMMIYGKIKCMIKDRPFPGLEPETPPRIERTLTAMPQTRA